MTSWRSADPQEATTRPPFAPGDPQRIYVTGYRLVGGTRQVTMYRSDDAGASWVALPTSDFVTTTNSDIIVGALGSGS